MLMLTFWLVILLIINACLLWQVHPFYITHTDILYYQDRDAFMKQECSKSCGACLDSQEVESSALAANAFLRKIY